MNTDQEQPEHPKQTHVPWLTGLVCAICIVVFIGLKFESNPDDWEAVSKWGAYPGYKIWMGAYWGLITSIFVHFDFLHFFFNLYWLWLFGSAVERSVSRPLWIALFISSAIVSSGTQLALSEGAGIGASGVVYALFGFMLVTRKRIPLFAQILSGNITKLFLAWLFICIVVTYAGLFNIGNAAHFSGILFGAGMGALFVLRWKPFILAPALGLFLALPIGALFWAPWSLSWLQTKAFQSQLANRPEEAAHWNSLVIQKDPKNAWAYFSRSGAYWMLGKRKEAVEDLETSIQLDPKNPQAQNTQAWWLATCPEDGFRNGKRAVEIATGACDLTEWKDPTILDTLAAAYAETGEFQQAVKWQEEAAKLVSKSEEKARYLKRVELYKSNQPCRDVLRLDDKK